MAVGWKCVHTVETFNVAPTQAARMFPLPPSMPGALTSRAASQRLLTYTDSAIINELRHFEFPS